MSRLIITIALVLPMIAQAGALAAQGVDETNYDQIDPETAYQIPGFIPAKRVKDKQFDFGFAMVGVGLKVNEQLGILLSKSTYPYDSVAVIFEEDMCSIGFQLRLPYREKRNSISVEFIFVGREGNIIETEKRWPATGTTRQSFTSEDFASRFAAVEFRAETLNEMAVGDIRILPCSAAVS